MKDITLVFPGTHFHAETVYIASACQVTYLPVRKTGLMSISYSNPTET
jgi:hypothetical protein